MAEAVKEEETARAVKVCAARTADAAARVASYRRVATAEVRSEEEVARRREAVRARARAAARDAAVAAARRLERLEMAAERLAVVARAVAAEVVVGRR